MVKEFVPPEVRVAFSMAAEALQANARAVNDKIRNAATPPEGVPKL